EERLVPVELVLQRLQARGPIGLVLYGTLLLGRGLGSSRRRVSGASRRRGAGRGRRVGRPARHRGQVLVGVHLGRRLDGFAPFFLFFRDIRERLGANRGGYPHSGEDEQEHGDRTRLHDWHFLLLVSVRIENR